MTSPTTMQLPSESKTQQTVQLPAWANQAGQQAVGIASNIATSPYVPFNGDLVAPQSSMTSSAFDLSKSLGDVGSSSNQAAEDAASQAAQLGRTSAGTGQGAIDAAGQLYGKAGSVASSTNPAESYLGSFSNLNNIGSNQALQNLSTGKSTTDAGATAANSLIAPAQATTGVGLSDASGMSALANLAAGGAVSTAGAGQGDLNSARGYTAGSATPISGADIAAYMNPYIEQSLNPAIRDVQRQSDTALQALQGNSAMTGAFGGSREAVLEGANARNNTEAIGNIEQTGYANAYTQAAQMAADQKNREAAAAGLSQGTGGLASSTANDAINRLINSANTVGAAGTTASNLTTEGQNRVANAATTSGQLGQLQSQQATDALARLSGQESLGLSGAQTANDVNTSNVNNLINAGKAQSDLATTKSNLATADQDRMLASVNPNLAVAQQKYTQVQQQMQDLIATGQIDQAQAQNFINAAYQQYMDQRNWAASQLNALTSTLSGVPYSTNSSSNTSGYTTGMGASPLAQIGGAVMSGVGAYGALK